jgi:hypothetical protein
MMNFNPDVMDARDSTYARHAQRGDTKTTMLELTEIKIIICVLKSNLFFGHCLHWSLPARQVTNTQNNNYKTGPTKSADYP